MSECDTKSEFADGEPEPGSRHEHLDHHDRPDLMVGSPLCCELGKTSAKRSRLPRASISRHLKTRPNQIVR